MKTLKHGYAGAEWLKEVVPLWNMRGEEAHKRRRKKDGEGVYTDDGERLW
jgi:hypothetical protein